MARSWSVRPTTGAIHCKPANRETWAEFQSAINEGDCWIDVRLEVAEDVGCVAEDIGVVSTSLKRAARKIDAVLTVTLPILAPAVYIKH
jgi:hypothetical protein